MQRLITVLSAISAVLFLAGEAAAQSAERSYDQGARAYRAQDMSAARDHFRRACDLGHGRGCYNYGVMSYQGLADGEPNMEHARWLYGRACEFDHAAGCFNLARMAFEGEGGPVDLAVARENFEISCNAGLENGCNGFAIMLEQGRGGPADPARARVLYQQACEAGESQACQNLAALDEGPVVAATYESLVAGIEAFNADRFREAMPLLRPHAEAGEATAQYAVGFMFAYGEGGVSRDYLMAADWLTRSAEQGYEAAQELIVHIGTNIAQARFIDHIDRYGPDASSLQSFSFDVAQYCTLRGPNCTALRARENQWRRDHNARAEAANMARIWNLYGNGQSDADFWAQSRARSECLRRVMQSTEAQMRDRQQWRYVNNC